MSTLLYPIIMLWLAIISFIICILGIIYLVVGIVDVITDNGGKKLTTSGILFLISFVLSTLILLIDYYT